MEKIKKKTESEKAGAVRGEKASDGNLLYHEQLEEGHHVGACRFCGQMKIFDNNGPVSPEDLNEAATMTCNCDDAKRYQAAEHMQQYARKRIESLFGFADGSAYDDADAVMADVMHSLIGQIFGKGFRKIVLQHNNGVKATISISGADLGEKIKIKREEKVVKEEALN